MTLQIYNSNTTNDVSQTIKINALIKSNNMWNKQGYPGYLIANNPYMLMYYYFASRVENAYHFFLYSDISFLSMEISRRINTAFIDYILIAIVRYSDGYMYCLL